MSKRRQRISFEITAAGGVYAAGTHFQMEYCTGGHGRFCPRRGLRFRNRSSPTLYCSGHRASLKVWSGVMTSMCTTVTRRSRGCMVRSTARPRDRPAKRDQFSGDSHTTAICRMSCNPLVTRIYPQDRLLGGCHRRCAHPVDLGGTCEQPAKTCRRPFDRESPLDAGLRALADEPAF